MGYESVYLFQDDSERLKEKISSPWNMVKREINLLEKIHIQFFELGARKSFREVLPFEEAFNLQSG